MPGGNARNRYDPSLPVTCTCGWMSAGPLAVTVTPGSTAPVLSVTVPLMRPLNSCAARDAPVIDSVTNTADDTTSFLNVIASPPGPKAACG